ncbi:MAG: hypothetical protein WBM54_15425 [Woeseia sp.]
MFEQLITWFRETVYPRESTPAVDLRRTDVRLKSPVQRASASKSSAALKATAKHPPAETNNEVRFESETGGRIEDAGPGKNVFVRSKYIREDAGTHDKLTIIGEDSLDVAEDEGGIDPYNTGQFDRSKNWNSRTRK